MSYRKNSENANIWNQWYKVNRKILIEIGVPEIIFENESRWYNFLEHGYDNETKWEYNFLSKQKVMELCSFLESIYLNGEFNSFIFELRIYIKNY